MEDGPEQEERDRILLHEKPGRGFPFLFADPELQRDLFAYDVGKEVERAWEQHGQSQGKARRQGQGVSGISSLL